MRSLPLALALLLIPAIGHAVTIKQMLKDERYWPKQCANKVCVLTGLGGIVDVWERHVDKHRGYTFVVKGTCASACRLAYLRAKARGEKTIVKGRLIYHKPSRAKWQ
jgi:hypothetical protein